MKTPTSLLACLAVPCLLSASFLLSPAPGLAQERALAAPEDPHAKMLEGIPLSDLEADDYFPSARTCASCHGAIYEEWSTSQHAYASISPMFHKFEQALNTLASGTVGAFCVRCHASVGTSMNEPRYTPVYDRPEVSREGVTCVTCHRVNRNYMKVNGIRALVPGKLTEPVFGPIHTDPNRTSYEDIKKDQHLNEEGYPKVHDKPEPREQLSKSEFCMSCHQVAVYPGIKLEVVWDQYKDSPAQKAGTTCQDCHMGKVIGDKVSVGDENYMKTQSATIGAKPFNPQAKHTDHSFPGPGYSIAHPGLFPQPRDPSPFTPKEWLAFDFRGWKVEPKEVEEFESKVKSGELKPHFVSDEHDAVSFDWSKREDRDAARAIIRENQKRLALRSEKRRKLMESGSHVDGPFFDSPRVASKDLEFHYEVQNISTGHNFPSGSLGAQPEIWLNVALLEPDGQGAWKNIWESGFVDSHGDMADLHSHDVLEGKIDPDAQLFNLQTKFLTTNLKGTDREMYLPVPFDGDQVPLIRPPGTPNTVMNHPPFIRMEQRSIPPLSSRTAKYSVPGKLLTKAGTYRLAVRLCSRAEPMYFMELVGSTKEMLQSMNEMMIDIHPYTVEFTVE